MRPDSDDTMYPSAGLLLLAGTPIGDARYVSEALRQGLESADVIAAEDTRKFADLCRRAEVHTKARIVSYFEGNETQRTPALIAEMTTGSTVVLVTDAGMPSVSDPGFRLVAACIESGISISAIPGPSAVLTALALSGLNTDRFCFEGFLPRKTGPRRTRLQALASEERTMVFFEAPHRLHDFLVDASEILGLERPGAICRELTKTYEEVIRDNLATLTTWSNKEVRGEITVVIAGATPQIPPIEDLITQVHGLLSMGHKRSAAVAQVAAHAGFNRQELYDAVLETTKTHTPVQQN